MIIKNKYLKHVVEVTAIFSLVIFCFVTGMNWKNTKDLQIILEESVEAQLISIAYAAQEMIDLEDFMSYNSAADQARDSDDYNQTLSALRLLAKDVNAQYIYALKKDADGNAFFVYDTDTEDDTVFVTYGLNETLEKAFQGHDVAGILNLSDEFGSYNTGAIPLWYDGEVVGIVAVDLPDNHIVAARNKATMNTIILSVLLAITLIVMIIGMRYLTNQVRKMRDKLNHDAHYDTVTGLPNRKYLMEYLNTTVTENPGVPFALLFIDLDNFKAVNDNAGHDAGDELLRHIAEYLEKGAGDSKSFRLSAGQLNIAARVGGDEFIQVIQNISTEEEAIQAASAMLEGFKKQNFDRYIDKYNVGMSIGIALYPYHSENFHVLIKYADVAMYHSKHSGKNTYSMYNESLPTVEK